MRPVSLLLAWAGKLTRSAFVLPVVVVWIGFGLRAFGLQNQSLWFDEGWSWHLAKMSLGDMAIATAADRSPFLYYAMLHVWLKLAGESEFAMRYLSLAADVAGLALVMALASAVMRAAKPVYPKQPRAPMLAAGLLYAASPFAVWYAQETRMYALVSALGSLSTYWLLRWLREWTSTQTLSRRAVLYSALALTAAVYSHYYAIFLLPAHAGVVLLVLALAKRSAAEPLNVRLAVRVWLHWVGGAVLTVLAIIPWLLVASPGFAYDDGFAFPLNTIEGRLHDWLIALASGVPARAAPAGWQVLIIGALAILVLGYAVTHRLRELLILVALVVFPALAATVAVRVFYPYRSVFHPRYLIYIVPAVCVLFAGLVRVRGLPRLALLMGLAPPALLSLLWVPALWANYSDPTVARDDVRAATRHVVEALAAGDLVVMTRDHFAVRYYYSMIIQQRPVSDTRWMAMPTGLHGVLDNDVEWVDALNAFRPDRVRLMLWQDDVVDPQQLVESTLWPHGYQIGEYNFGSIRLPLYHITDWPVREAPWQSIDAVFGDQLRLTGFWSSAQSYAGDWFYVVLLWQPIRVPDAAYRVFIHVLDTEGRIVFQKDKLPLNSLIPMTRWRPAQTIRDPYATVVPPDTPAGLYRIVVGVYDESGARLPVRSDRATDSRDAVSLGMVQVIRR
ncbi:MAG: hypothetical protein RMN25_13950 [Anaerolineae bacterium]|nr:hypothetical protein [Thermoflexales bacterium]MDW8408874.1 hypothetical protein [Anaerolineae bacterium]